MRGADHDLYCGPTQERSPRNQFWLEWEPWQEVVHACSSLHLFKMLRCRLYRPWRQSCPATKTPSKRSCLGHVFTYQIQRCVSGNPEWGHVMFSLGCVRTSFGLGCPDLQDVCLTWHQILMLPLAFSTPRALPASCRGNEGYKS